MCGRFALRVPRSRIAERYFGFQKPVGDVIALYNITPGRHIATIQAGEQQDTGVAFRESLWGFRPQWADESAPQPINAKSETVATSRYFRDAFAHRRCLIPASGWYEWRKTDSGKQPHYITLADNDDIVMFFAGIWESTDPKTLASCCAILTEPTSPQLAHIHSRQPVVLDPDCRYDWVNPEITEREAVRSIARRLDSVHLASYPVSTRVNRPENDDEGLIEPACRP